MKVMELLDDIEPWEAGAGYTLYESTLVLEVLQAFALSLQAILQLSVDFREYLFLMGCLCQVLNLQRTESEHV